MGFLTGIFSNIKNWLIAIGAAVIGFFIWKNNSDRKEAEEELQQAKDEIIDGEIETAKKAAVLETERVKKELETKIKVLKDIGNTEDKEQIAELEKKLKEAKNKDTEISFVI